ncbi:MAG: diguanylate cyclase [Spirochaetales bacterium]|nr:diguanylate cyclase [Spirochaetales bacterium]
MNFFNGLFGNKDNSQSLPQLLRVDNKKEKKKKKKEILNSIILQSMNESEREKEQILNSLDERVCYLDLDYNIKWLNSSGLKSISPDSSIEDILGRHCYNILHDLDRPCENCPVTTTLHTGWPWKEEVEQKDGSTYLVSAQPVFDDNGTMTGIIEVQLDISFRKDIEHSLERSRRRGRALLDAIPDLLLIFNNSGNLIDYHPAANFDLLTYGENPEGKHLTSAIPGKLAVEILNHSKSLTALGAVRNFEFTETDSAVSKSYDCRLVKTGADEKVCIIRDVSSEKIRQKEILFKSFHDSLTGLYNRAYFEEELNRIDQSRKALPTSILIIDVNGLKFTNDAFGHEYGDKLLKTIATILSANSRKGEVIARIGGDEFSIILPDSPLGKAEKLADRIIKACSDSGYDEFFVRPSVSIGCADKNDNSVSLRDIIKIADEKMYRTKLSNREKHLNSLISDILKTMNKRSNESNDHIRRCIKLAEIFAKRLNLSSTSSENISKLATLHDVGKIRIPKEILLKTESLTDAETELIKQHSIIGYRITKAIPDYSLIADLILYHHERWDGCGYPSGLNKKEIPLESRIFMLIDSFDAMTHDSPYKKAILFDEAVTELRNNSGKQFDPELIETFISILIDEKDKNAG